MKNKICKIAFWLWFGIILILSVIPNTPEQKIEFFGSPIRLDYLEHFGIFFILGMLYILWTRSLKLNPMLTLVLYAVCTELIQIFIPGRTFNPWDFIYNVLGLLIGVIVVNKIIIKKLRINWKIIRTQQ